MASYNDSVVDIATRAACMKKVLVDPFRTNDGFLTPRTQIEADERNSILSNSIKGTVYEAAGKGAEQIAAVHSRSLQNYANTHNGALPPDDLLASVHRSIENALVFIGESASASGVGVFESAEMKNTMATTEGIMMRDRMVSLTLPVQLQTITHNFITFMPGEHNSSEFFRIKRVAASTFGDLKKGDNIDFNYNGLYSVMDQTIKIGVGDGIKKTFEFDSKAHFGTVYPFVNHLMKVIYDHEIVGADNGTGALAGTMKMGTEQVVVSGTVDYYDGKCTISFSTAPLAGIDIHLGFDVNIERAPDLIPRIDHVMESRVLRPHESAIAGKATLQALFRLRRELGLDIDNMTMQSMRNLLAADKDKKHLNDMYFYAKGTTVWDRNYSDQLSLTDNYETLKQALLNMSSIIMKRTGTTGLVGLVGDTLAVNIFKYLPSQFFQPAPGYREIPQAHYVGRVFGLWDLYCDPWKEKEYSCLGFGRGSDHGQTAYVAGDAIPAMMFSHPRLGDLQNNHTLWDLAYRDIQPFDGATYLTNLEMVDGTNLETIDGE